MIKSLAFLLVIGVVSSLSDHVQAMPAPTRTYQHSAVLTPDEFVIYWNVTADSEFVFEIHCIMSKWMGFGLSLDKSQNDGVVFLIWGVEDGDCFA